MIARGTITFKGNIMTRNQYFIVAAVVGASLVWGGIRFGLFLGSVAQIEQERIAAVKTVTEKTAENLKLREELIQCQQQRVRPGWPGGSPIGSPPGQGSPFGSTPEPEPTPAAPRRPGS